MYDTPYSERMGFRDKVQGFALGAAVMAGAMLALPVVLAPTGPLTDSEEIAAQFGVEIVWSTDRCAFDYAVAGCFYNSTPNTIYVSPLLGEPRKTHVVLHEIGHVIRNRLGLRGLPDGECAADKFAQSLGSVVEASCPLD